MGDYVGGFIALGILIAIAWYLALFGKVEEDKKKRPH